MVTRWKLVKLVSLVSANVKIQKISKSKMQILAKLTLQNVTNADKVESSWHDLKRYFYVINNYKLQYKN